MAKTPDPQPGKPASAKADGASKSKFKSKSKSKSVYREMANPTALSLCVYRTPEELAPFVQWIAYYRHGIQTGESDDELIDVIKRAPALPTCALPETVQLVRLFNLHVRLFPNASRATKRYALQLLVYVKNVCLLLSSIKM